jgi:hypothetical protein
MDLITAAMLWTPPLPPRCHCRRHQQAIAAAAALPSRPPQPTRYFRRCRCAIAAAANVLLPPLPTRYCCRHRHYRAACSFRSNAVAATTTALPSATALPAATALMLLPL